MVSYLQDRSQCVVINETKSKEFDLHQGVSQGSCLGPIKFIEYSSPVFDLVAQHDKSVHAYADDHQVYSPCRPASIDHDLMSMQNCMSAIRDWMKSMHLKMNPTKTEFIIFGTARALSKCNNPSITIGDAVITPSKHVRNLGAYFDENMSMKHHVSIQCKRAYSQLYKISKIRKYLDQQSAEIIMHALVHTHIDYCNALLIGLPKYLIRKLQMVQNTAARVLCRLRKFDHISDTLKQLHWLPVEYRIKYKIGILTFNALHGHVPRYITDMLSVKHTSHALRSHDTITLVVPRTRCKTLGDRAFCVAAPVLWNALPPSIRTIPDIIPFKRALKTYYFNFAYP